MAISERTYTFRAPAELGEQIRAMGQLMAQLDLTADAHVSDRVGREVAIRLARRVQAGQPVLSGDNQSAFLREIVELFVASARKIATDLGWEKVYAAEREAETEADRKRHLDFEALSAEAWGTP